MRIISGVSKGRRLTTPKGQGVRPTSDRVKESIFNILGGEVAERVVLDLFAGTGNLGIEALSRGARDAVFVEEDTPALNVLRRNLETLGLEDRSRVLPLPVKAALKKLAAMERTDVSSLVRRAVARYFFIPADSNTVNHKP